MARLLFRGSYTEQGLKGVLKEGGAKATSTPLITPEEVDQATKKAVNYRPPGQ
jgi:hypothetical protein